MAAWHGQSCCASLLPQSALITHHTCWPGWSSFHVQHLSSIHKACVKWDEGHLAQVLQFRRMQVSEQDLTQALEAAVTCCILAAAGPQRSRVLANLYKDERTRSLPVFPFLEKVYLERILRREEVRTVQPPCAPFCSCHGSCRFEFPAS